MRVLALMASAIAIAVAPQISETDDLGPPVVPGGQEIGLGSRNLRPRAHVQGGGTSHGARVSRERLGDWDGPMAV